MQGLDNSDAIMYSSLHLHIVHKEVLSGDDSYAFVCSSIICCPLSPGGIQKRKDCHLNWFSGCPVKENVTMKRILLEKILLLALLSPCLFAPGERRRKL